MRFYEVLSFCFNHSYNSLEKEDPDAGEDQRDWEDCEGEEALQRRGGGLDWHHQTIDMNLRANSGEVRTRGSLDICCSPGFAKSQEMT